MTRVRSWLAAHLAGRLKLERPRTLPHAWFSAPNRADATEAAGLREYVAVILSARQGPRLVQISAADAIAATVRLAGVDYVDSGAGDWLGFYDWLRDRASQVIGVQQWIDTISTYPFSKEFAGLEADQRNARVRIFFGPCREVDENLSCDQDFGSNRLLIAEDSIALTFNAADPPSGANEAAASFDAP